MKARLIAACALIATSAASGQATSALGDPMLHLSTVHLYDIPPGAKGDGVDDVPSLTVFPPFGEPDGTAVIIAPGGAYQGLAGDLEGREVADWFASRGVTAFVLRYRLGSKYPFPVPLMDAQRAVQYVRANAAHYKLQPRKIGFIGFSAGGHLAAVLETQAGTVPGGPIDTVSQQSARPDFVILGYPAFSMFNKDQKGNLAYCVTLKVPASTCTPGYLEQYTPALHITSSTPPTFIYHTADDATIPVEDSVNYFLALKRAGVPSELHVFEKGVHGTGLAGDKPALRAWPGLLEQWLIGGGFLPR
ncbi:alpha/beta hydrolase [Luteibacter aegosomatissinici]|uniref:alpha/beta hydrolase n=1 Tax=Luteibacter aegosomatissinici TaxID=2911539 RepID=UPI001FFAD199|nr:alpha/beta hydrolase [Luteibacter aegosomatissinici]UPG93205.1 alpha/beta hydrolase [Luteibacter aegosomatissinici]